MKRVSVAAIASVLVLTACDSFGQAMTSHTDVLARAAGHEFPVDSAVSLLAPATRIPAQPEVVDAIANLWIDYTLLATAAAQDSTLQNVDLDAVITPYFNQQLVFQLRDRVIEVDTVLTDEQLRAAYQQEQPNAEVRARHILFRMPPDAAQPVQDSVMRLARQVMEQARGGADFAELAAQYSEEPGAAERGGDLGYFGPGQMIPQFEDVAFRLTPGSISEPVVTPFGVHIIKVEDKRLPDYESVRDEFRQQYIQQKYGEAEEGYLTQLTEAKQVTVEDGAADVARELARKPGTQLSRRAAQRPLVRYTGGALTAGEYMRLMQQRPAQQRGQVAAADDEQLREWLRLLARDEILIEEARGMGIVTAQSTQDSARAELREQIRQGAREAGLLPITPAEGETMNQAVQRSVSRVLQGIINGEMDVMPLGAIGFSLREQFGAEVFERAVPVVVSRVEERRPPGSEMQNPQMPPAPPQGGQAPPPGGQPPQGGPPPQGQ